jgi:hypothetical protein
MKKFVFLHVGLSQYRTSLRFGKRTRPDHAAVTSFPIARWSATRSLGSAR